MAHKKAGGSTRLGRDSQPQYLGVKVSGGGQVHAGGVIIRQRGTKYHPGTNVKRAGDDTLVATITGTVQFVKKKAHDFRGALQKRTFVNVIEHS